MVNDNPFNDLLHRVENYDIELLEYVAGKKRAWQNERVGARSGICDRI